MADLSIRGHVFDIQSYCIHDGPGIRSTVFVKGCPLRCRWCQNPESQSAEPQLMYYTDKCVSCGACAGACPQGAVGWTPGEKPKTDRALCTACGACVDACMPRAREITGRTMTVAEAIKQVLNDRLFLEGSGGGMTVSGGEPLMQPIFTAALLEAAHDEGLSTAIETCNFASREVIDKVYRHVDLGLCDIKHMDSQTHRRITGVPNEAILDNIRHIHNELKIPVRIRFPVVPGYNGELENVAATAKFIARELGKDVPLHLLPYHRLGESKGQSLEREDYALHVEPPSDEYMSVRKAVAEEYGLTVLIGG